MDDIRLCRDDLVVSFDAAAGRLHFELSGERLPWELDLEQTTCISVRPKKPGAAQGRHTIRLDKLMLRRLSLLHRRWIGEVGGAGVALKTELAADGPVFTVSPVGTGEAEVEVDWTRAHPYRKRITDPETQSALPKALRVCRLNERHGVARMLSHRFLDESSPFVQESEFETGLHVVVNFGDEPHTLEGGRTVDARAALVKE